MNYIMETPIKGVIGGENFLTTIHWRNGVLVTDEPEILGGQDLGPDPFTLLLSSLVSCTLASLKMYVNHKGISIPEFVVEANMFQKINSEGTVMHIERRIAIPNLIEEDLRQRLLRVAESCPVSKILKGNIQITSEFEMAGTKVNETENNENLA